QLNVLIFRRIDPRREEANDVPVFVTDINRGCGLAQLSDERRIQSDAIHVRSSDGVLYFITTTGESGGGSIPKRRIRQPNVEFQIDVAVALDQIAVRIAAGGRPVVRFEPYRQLQFFVEVNDTAVAIKLPVVDQVARLHA